MFALCMDRWINKSFFDVCAHQLQKMFTLLSDSLISRSGYGRTTAKGDWGSDSGFATSRVQDLE